MSVSIHDLRTWRERGEKFVMVTAYDALTARICDDAGIPLLLVGDDGTDYEPERRALIRVGLDDVRGTLAGGMRTWIEAGFEESSLPQISVAEVAGRVAAGALLLDVRGDGEWNTGHAAGAHHRATPQARAGLDEAVRADEAVGADHHRAGDPARARPAPLDEAPAQEALRTVRAVGDDAGVVRHLNTLANLDAAAGLDHVFERDQKGRAVFLRQHLREVFGGVFRVAQPFFQIIPITF